MKINISTRRRILREFDAGFHRVKALRSPVVAEVIRQRTLLRNKLRNQRIRDAAKEVRFGR